MLKFKKGDKVEVIAGKDKGKQGDIVTVLPLYDKIIVKGINIVTKHKKPNNANVKGEILTVEAPIHLSNVMLICPEKKIKTRVGFGFDGENKFRFSKKSNNKL